jgi:hypothetical protein
MIHNTGTYHVQVNIHQTAQEVFPSFYGSSVIPILPVRTFALFSLIVLLGTTTSNQLDRSRNGIPITISYNH